MEVETEREVDVFDPTEDEDATHRAFSITSFGADYPVEIIPARIRSGDWYTPLFQRNFVWSLNQASRFIESLLLGLPVPGIFLFKEIETGKHLIIDGQQRTKSLQLFFDGDDFGPRKFRLSNVSDPYNGKSFDELDDSDQRRLRDSIVHATIFQQKSPEGDISSVYEVFERINTGGSKLSAQEIRSCVNHGPVVEFLEELASKGAWMNVFRSSSKRLKDHELILRFFAFLDNDSNYSSPMKKFLDDYMRTIRDLNDQKYRKMEDLFDQTFEFISEKIKEKPFRPERAFNAAVFDSISVHTARLIQSNSVPENYIERYNSLMADEEFVGLASRSTADPERVKSRFAIAHKYLAE
tara:strand:- start:565 stop:1623 length:1059 start_codon:yes stop_codon:yes gene_type:complete